MRTMDNSIPIFPLNLVIFPDSSYQLHIFEEKYKRLVARCLENEEYFGITATIDDSISDIGCSVEITEVIKRYENGNMDIVVTGVKRFQVISKYLHEDGYLEASTIPFDDVDDTPDYDLVKVKKAVNKFQRILDLTNIELTSSYWKNLESSVYKSYKIAEKSGLNIKQQQNLLSFQSENERLSYLLNHFENLETYLEHNQIVRDIVMRDGYINE